MYGYEIPFHIQEEIMKRLPVKSLIQFRSVSKAWKSLIDSSHFIAAHSFHRHTRPQHLLVLFITLKKEKKCVCLMDDETLFQQRPLPNSPPYVKENLLSNIVGISQGLVCFYYPDAKHAVLWNPSIRKSIAVDVPKSPFVGQRFVGFGVCPATTDHKIVAIKQSWVVSNIENRYECEVMIYSLSSGIWRSLSSNLPTTSLRRWWEAVAADGFIYWVGGFPGHNTIISFDLTNESFQMIDLDNTLARQDPGVLHITKLRESLAMLQYDRNRDTYTVWKMEGGVQRSFSKLFSIHAPENSLMGFRRSGVPILQVKNDGQTKLVVYEPNSQHNNVFDNSRRSLIITVDSYSETLLLLGRSDCSSY